MAVAEAVSVATLKFHDIYVERRGDQYRWSLATKGGPYPLLRITARFLEMDPYSLAGVGSRVVGDDGWCANRPDRHGAGRMGSVSHGGSGIGGSSSKPGATGNCGR